MKAEFIYYLTEFLPLFLGVCVLILARRVNLRSSRLRINTSSDLSDLDLERKDILSGYGRGSVAFGNIAVDSLIVNGVYYDKIDDAVAYAGHGLGLINVDDKAALMNARPEVLNLYSRNGYSVVHELFKSSRLSSILLAYLAEGKLRLVGVHEHL